MPAHIRIAGQKNSGKTRLIEVLTSELTRLGFRVAAVKHTSHDHEFDRPKTDTWRYRKAGSETAIIISPNNWVCHTSIPDPDTQKRLEDMLFCNKDLVFWEGMAKEDIQIIECVGAGTESLHKGNRLLIATVSKHEIRAEIPNFDPNSGSEIVRWIIKKLNLRNSGDGAK
jgi:molybdopterin-guanine dinucleotide biosynthesis protein B